MTEARFPESTVPYNQEFMNRANRAFWSGVADPSIVDMDGWKESNGILITTGLLPCVAVAVFNTRERRGILGHFSDAADPDITRVYTLDDRPGFMGPMYHRGSLVFHEALAAIPELGPIDHTRIWLGGGDIYDYEDETPNGYYEDTQANRDEIEERLRGLAGIDQQNIGARWENGSGGIDVGLDCQAGMVTVVNDSSRSSRQFSLNW